MSVVGVVRLRVVVWWWLRLQKGIFDRIESNITGGGVSVGAGAGVMLSVCVVSNGCVGCCRYDVVGEPEACVVIRGVAIVACFV